MKIAIVCTYYNRLPQLVNTIKSLRQYGPADFKLIVVDDNSPEPISINESFMEIVRLTEKTWFNSGIPYNVGFKRALDLNPDIIIIQNAESYHAGDIFDYAKRHLTRSNYISFSCYSLEKEDLLPPDIMRNRCATFDGDGAWYNHPIHRPVGYHFCTAILSENLRKINGFDERFKDGCDWEDNYLLHQIKTLGLRLEIPAEPFVYHQWHYSAPRPKGTSDNAVLYQKLIQEKQYRAVHLLTPDL